jgi:hypothetical protein
VLIESMLMALPGAVLGAIAAWALFNGHPISPVCINFDLAVTVSRGLIRCGSRTRGRSRS